MKILTMNEVRSMIQNGSNAFVGCALAENERFGFYACENGELESGNWIECEGGRELVINENGIILGYFPYYE